MVLLHAVYFKQVSLQIDLKDSIVGKFVQERKRQAKNNLSVTDM